MRLSEKDIKNWLTPTLLTLLCLKAVIFGAGVPEAIIFGFLSALFGVDKFFYLKRLHQVEKRKHLQTKKDIEDLKSYLNVARLQQNKQAQSMPGMGNLGNIPWNNKI